MPAGKLWEAVTKGEHTRRFFVDKVEGISRRTHAGPVAVGEWGRLARLPTVVQKEKKLEFRWADHPGKYLTTVTFTLKKKGKLIELAIEERGWKQADLNNAFDNCSGWSMYQDYLKAYLLHGIDLRTEKAKN